MDYYTKEEVDKMIEEAIGTAVERALVSLPLVVKNLVTTFAGLKAMGDRFLEDNKDLVPHKELIKTTMERIEGENPNLTYEELLKRTAETVRSSVRGAGQTPNGEIRKMSRKEADENITNILGG